MPNLVCVFREQLAYEASRDSAKDYLKKTHARYLPEAADGEVSSGNPRSSSYEDQQ